MRRRAALTGLATALALALTPPTAALLEPGGEEFIAQAQGTVHFTRTLHNGNVLCNDPAIFVTVTVQTITDPPPGYFTVLNQLESPTTVHRITVTAFDADGAGDILADWRNHVPFCTLAGNVYTCGSERVGSRSDALRVDCELPNGRRSSLFLGPPGLETEFRWVYDSPGCGCNPEPYTMVLEGLVRRL